MKVKIMLRVKFRAFFVDIAKFCKLVDLDLTNGLKPVVSDFDEKNAPATAKKVVDQNGVVLKVWQG